MFGEEISPSGLRPSGDIPITSHLISQCISLNSSQYLVIATQHLIIIVRQIRPKYKFQLPRLGGVRTKGYSTVLLDPTQVESKKSSQIQWPVPSINAEPVDIFLGEE